MLHGMAASTQTETEERLCSRDQCRKTHKICVCERLEVSLGIRKHQKSWLPEAAWVWLVKVPGGRRLARGLAPVAATHSSSADTRPFHARPLLYLARGPLNSAFCHREMMRYVRLMKNRYNVHKVRLYFIGHLRDLFEGHIWTVCIFSFPDWLQNQISTSYATSQTVLL